MWYQTSVSGLNSMDSATEHSWVKYRNESTSRTPKKMMTRLQAKRLDGRPLINMWRDFPCCCTVSWVLWPPERNNDRTLCNFITEEHPRISQKNVKTARWGTHYSELAALSLQLLVFIMSCSLSAGPIFQSVPRRAQVTELRSLVHMCILSAQGKVPISCTEC